MSDKITSTLAKTDDGEVQITFSIPTGLVTKHIDEVVAKAAETAEIAGFRKGKAPINKVKESLSEERVSQEALSKVLPQALAEAINEHKLKPAIYPRFELVSKDESAWSVRATTCEIPEFELGNWKDAIRGASKSSAIWLPGKEAKDQTPTPEQKEQIAIKALLDVKVQGDKTVKDLVPNFLITEETNSRLSQLLERTEKLGLSIDSYLASIGKNPQGLREEYSAQASEEIAADLILQKIAQIEKVTVTPEEVEKTIAALGFDEAAKKRFEDPREKSLVQTTLIKRAALEIAANLV